MRRVAPRLEGSTCNSLSMAASDAANCPCFAKFAACAIVKDDAERACADVAGCAAVGATGVATSAASDPPAAPPNIRFMNPICSEARASAGGFSINRGQLHAITTLEGGALPFWPARVQSRRAIAKGPAVALPALQRQERLTEGRRHVLRRARGIRARPGRDLAAGNGWRKREYALAAGCTVFWEVALITPAVTPNPAMYCEAVVWHPAAVALAGTVPPLDAVYSATDVLQAAMAAMVSDIFERTM